MNVLWKRGESNVREVTECLERPLAYTTVMTTLDRLFKKGLLLRTKFDRAFVYSPRQSRVELEQQHAGEYLATWLNGQPSVRELLVSCLLDSAGPRDEAILDELERKIRSKRRELRKRREP